MGFDFFEAFWVVILGVSELLTCWGMLLFVNAVIKNEDEKHGHKDDE